MKVFYVVVLVLVAWAVTSYGRTECEGTVFNKTQIHESMNNGTESSSKVVIVPFGDLIFAMQWPRSFCKFYNCPQQPSYFTVHGLWPQNNSLRPPEINCRGRCGLRIPFDHGQLDRRLLLSLNKYWPNLRTTVVGNPLFWEWEYNKHGCCTFNNQFNYFHNSLLLFGQLGNLAWKLSHIGGGRSIFPGSRITSAEMSRAVYDVTSYWPWLVCYSRSIQLLEIRFCAIPHVNGIALTNCSIPSNCENGEVYFP